MAVQEVFGGQFSWCADNDRHVQALLAARYPGVPNLGDIAAIEWAKVEPVDVICAGFPCQDISYAGPVPALNGGLAVESGSTSWRAFACYSRRSSSWRTWPRCVVAGSTVYSPTWPRTGMTRSGRAYERVTSAHRTDASGCSSSPTARKPTSCPLLPTPVASDGHGGQPVEQRRAGGHQVDLSDLAPTLFPVGPLLPTPLAGHGTSPSQRSIHGTPMLAGAAARTMQAPSNGGRTSQPSGGGKRSRGGQRHRRQSTAREAKPGSRRRSASG